jgi:hypothetical protein
MNTAITDIIEVDSLGGTTPARVHRPSGTMFIDKAKFRQMPKDQRFYVLLHEAGHATLNSPNEDDADSFASKYYLEAGYPVSGSVKALTRNLNFDKPGHWNRAQNQLKRALYFDKMKKIHPESGIKNWAFTDPRFDLSFAGDEGDINDFLGMGKKARERRKQKKDDKQQRKLEKIEARADAAVRKRGAGGGIGGVLGDLVGGIFGKKGGDEGGDMAMAADPSAGGTAGTSVPAKKNKPMIIAGVVLLVLIIGAVIFFRSKKK